MKTNNKFLLSGALLLMVAACGRSGGDKADTMAIDREIAAATASRDSIAALLRASSATRDMYQGRRDSLNRVLGAKETAAARARKNKQWRQYRDSVSKYGDQTIDLAIARDWAQFRVDSLLTQREIMKMR